MKEPRFWSREVDPRSREGAPLTRLLFTPLAMLYARTTANRIARTDPWVAPIPVICVGNLTAGGSGKSPVVAALREKLSRDDLRVATLSRGYGGSNKGPHQVDPETDIATDVGDEPLMLAQTGEAWIGVDRVETARLMAASGVDLIIMDDGHQNPSLHKDLSLVVVDATRRHRASPGPYTQRPRRPHRHPTFRPRRCLCRHRSAAEILRHAKRPQSRNDRRGPLPRPPRLHQGRPCLPARPRQKQVGPFDHHREGLYPPPRS